MNTKQEQRKYCTKKRRELTEANKIAFSNYICKKIQQIPCYKDAKLVLSYMASFDEANPCYLYDNTDNFVYDMTTDSGNDETKNCIYQKNVNCTHIEITDFNHHATGKCIHTGTNGFDYQSTVNCTHTEITDFNHHATVNCTHTGTNDFDYLSTVNCVYTKAENAGGSEHRIFAYPVSLENGIMKAYIPAMENGFEEGKFGIKSPRLETSTLVNPEDIDLVIVPCVGFDENKNRLGHGKGYYDRFLPLCKNAKFICIAFEAQKLEHIATDDFDVKMDFVITEEKIY